MASASPDLFLPLLGHPLPPLCPKEDRLVTHLSLQTLLATGQDPMGSSEVLQGHARSDSGDEEVGIVVLSLLPVGAGFCFPPKAFDLSLLGKTQVTTIT